VKVLLLPTCLPNLFYPGAVGAARRVLERAGCEVEQRKAAVCCGQPGWNSGHLAEARRVASGALEALAGNEVIVSCSGSCATMIHEYWPELFADTRYEDDAHSAASRIREFSSFLADDVGPESLGPAALEPNVVAAYHDSCHMMRALGVKSAPRRLLERVQGLELRALDTAERCCGFGGTFSLRYPELSAAVADEKIDDASSKGITRLIASDLGCLMHITGRAAKRGIPLRPSHVAEVLDEAIPQVRAAM
jgi:L-lactate dehydrogenase complex protein LldE